MLRKKKKRRGRSRGRGRRGNGGAGIYPALKTLGVIAGAGPALCERAVLGVLSNTFEEAGDALRRDGVMISVKRLRTISMKFSSAALELRRQRAELMAPDKDGPPSLRGKRIAVTIDGGRIRTRLAKRRKGFYTDWKEPKLFSIYEIGGDGRKAGKGLVACDGTIDGPDGLTSLLAAELVARRAVEAESITIIADGAPWIWNSIGGLIRMAGLDAGKVTRILDFYHAAEHLKAISEILYGSQAKQTQMFNKMRRMLKDRAPKVFMAELA